MSLALLPELVNGPWYRIFHKTFSFASWLGISGTEIDQILSSELNLAVDNGVYVVSVVPDSPAEKAGLVPGGSDQSGPTPGGDVITTIDGRDVAAVSDILQYLNTKKAGDQVSLTVIREGSTITVDVTLGEWPQDTFPQG